MSRILAIESSSELCTVALLCDGTIGFRAHLGVRDHTRQVLPFVDELLADAGLTLSSLDALAVGRGPGSFTGLRVAVSMVQGLALGAGLGVAAVSSLQALALQARELGAEPRVLVLLDARMDEVYAGAFDCRGALPVLIDEERLCAPERVVLPDAQADQAWSLAGSGLVYGQRLPVTGASGPALQLAGLKPRAQEIARIAGQVLQEGALLAPEQVQPVYLRNRVAERPRR